MAVSLEQLKIKMNLEILSFCLALALCVKSRIWEILGNHLLLNIQLQEKNGVAMIGLVILRIPRDDQNLVVPIISTPNSSLARLHFLAARSIT